MMALSVVFWSNYVVLVKLCRRLCENSSKKWKSKEVRHFTIYMFRPSAQKWRYT